jgi:hypothetical protein
MSFERKVDLTLLNENQVVDIAGQLNARIKEVLGSAAKECNRFLEVYGLHLGVMFRVEPIQEIPSKDCVLDVSGEPNPNEARDGKMSRDVIS